MFARWHPSFSSASPNLLPIGSNIHIIPFIGNYFYPMEVHNFWEDAKMRVRGSGYDYEPSPIVIVRFWAIVCLFVCFFLIICFSLRKFIFFVGISYFDFRRAGNQTQKTQQQQQQMWWKRQRERNRIEDDQQISANSLFRSTQKKKRVEICDFFVVNNTLQKKPNDMISDRILRFLLISFWRSWILLIPHT